MPSPYKKRKINGKTLLAHRVVWEEHHGPIPEGYHVHHKNGDKRDNRIENLEVLSPQDHSEHHNLKHPKTKTCVACGRTFTPPVSKRARAKTCNRECFRKHAKTFRGSAKLSLDQYAEIVRRVEAGEMQKDLAAEFGVSRPAISYIMKRHRSQI